jgi:hypothetical protein
MLSWPLACACFGTEIFLKVPWHPFACSDAEEDKETFMLICINTVNECHTLKTRWFFYYFFFRLVLDISSRPKTGNFAGTNAVCVCESWNETAVEVFLLASTPCHCAYPCAQNRAVVMPNVRCLQSCFPSYGEEDALHELLRNRDVAHFLCNTSLC